MITTALLRILKCCSSINSCLPEIISATSSPPYTSCSYRHKSLHSKHMVSWIFTTPPGRLPGNLAPCNAASTQHARYWWLHSSLERNVTKLPFLRCKMNSQVSDFTLTKFLCSTSKKHIIHQRPSPREALESKPLNKTKPPSNSHLYQSCKFQENKAEATYSMPKGSQNPQDPNWRGGSSPGVSELIFHILQRRGDPGKPGTQTCETLCPASERCYTTATRALYHPTPELHEPPSLSAGTAFGRGQPVLTKRTECTINRIFLISVLKDRISATKAMLVILLTEIWKI